MNLPGLSGISGPRIMEKTMGIDLTLLPVEFESSDKELAYSHSILHLPRWYDFFEEVRKCPMREMQGRFATFMGRSEDGEYAYGDTKQDAYGSPIYFVWAKDLKKAMAKMPETGADWCFRSAKAYVDAMPDDGKIALYWH